MGRFRIRITFIFGFVFIPFFCAIVFAEGVVITPSTDCMSCDGIASYSSDIPGDVNYQWFDSDSVLIFSEVNSLGSSQITGLCSEVFFVEATGLDDFESCVFNVPTAPTNPGESIIFETCNDAAPSDLFTELNGNPVPGGSWTDPNGNPVTSIFTPNASDDGLYTYTILEGGCSVNSGVLVSTNDNADPGNTTTYLICDTYSSFFLTDFMGGTPDPGGQWYGPGNVPVDGWFYPDSMESSQFLYTIDTVPGCAPVSSAMFVVVNYLPDVGLNTELMVCPGAVQFNMTDQLGGTPELTGQWFDENNIAVSNLFDPSTWDDGIYTYQINGETPCPNQQSTLDISFTNGVDAGDDASISLCESEGLVNMFNELEGNPSTSGVWYDPSNNLSSGIFDPSAMIDGTYTYEVTGIGCIPSTAVLSIDVENLLNAGIDNEVDVCQDLEVYNLDDLLSNDAMPGGIWYDDLGMEIAPNVSLIDFSGPSFTYQLEGVLCPNDASNFIINLDESVSAGDDQILVFCEDEDEVNLANYVNDPGLLNFEWTDFDGNIVIPNFDPENDVPGEFYYTIISDNSCPDDVAILNVSTESISFIDGMSSIEVCTSSENINLDESLGTINPNLGVWTTPQNIETPNELSLEDAESGIYTFTSTENVACPIAMFELDLQIIEQLEAGDDGSLNLCSDSEVVNLYELLDNQTSDDGNWFFNDDTIEGQFDPSINPPGEYTYLIDALFPCLSSEAIIDIEVIESIIFNSGEDVSACSGSEPIELGQEGQDNCTYLWSPTTYLSNVNIPNPILDFSFPIEFVEEIEYILFIDNGTCSRYDTVIVEIFPLPNVDLGDDLEICDESSLSLNGGVGSVYEWSPNWLFDDVNLQSQEIVMESMDLEVELTIENEYGCFSSDDLSIVSLEIPHVDFDASPEEGCVPLEVQLFNLSVNDMMVDYQWQFSNGIIDDTENPSYIFYEEGSHDISLIALAENGCENSTTIYNFIEAHPVPMASFSFNEDELSVLNTNLELYNESLGASEYIWSMDNSVFSTNVSPILGLDFMPDVFYNICLVANNDYQCTDTICKSVYVPGEFLIYVPNAFTPDNDGINDVFLPIVQGVDEGDYSLMIFNRWGELVFETTTLSEPWIGNHQKSDYYVPDGTYIWQLNAQDLYTSEMRQFTGHVTVFR